ncbi:MAG: hypothetical protein ACRDRW_01265 [Pseudonocardiaceae bacterium]
MAVFINSAMLSGVVPVILAAEFLSGGEIFRLFLLAAALVASVVGVVLRYIPAANAYFAQSWAYRAMRR